MIVKFSKIVKKFQRTNNFLIELRLQLYELKAQTYPDTINTTNVIMKPKGLNKSYP